MYHGAQNPSKEKKRKEKIASKKHNTIVRLVCLSDKNTWKYQHCLLLTRFLDSLTFPFSSGKWGMKKPQIHWCFHCRMVVSYTLITRWKKALPSKLQSVNNWVHNHNHGLVMKVFWSCKNHVSPWALEWAWYVSINVLWVGRFKTENITWFDGRELRK